MRCVERFQDDAIGSIQILPPYCYHLCQLGTFITERTKKKKQTVIVFWGVLFVCLFVSVMIDPGIHTKWVNETETLFQALLAIFHNYLCIQLISKNFPLYTIFYMYLFREIAIVMIKIYHVLCGTWWNLQYNINSKYIITGQKNGLFL